MNFKVGDTVRITATNQVGTIKSIVWKPEIRRSYALVLLPNSEIEISTEYLVK